MPYYSQPFLKFEDTTPVSWLCFEYDGESVALLHMPYPFDGTASWQPGALPEKTPLFSYDTTGAPCAFWYEDNKLYQCSMTPKKTIGGVFECHLSPQNAIEWKLLPSGRIKIHVDFPEHWHRTWDEGKKAYSTLLPENVVIPQTPESRKPSPEIIKTPIEIIFQKLREKIPNLPLSHEEQQSFINVIGLDWNILMQDVSEEKCREICDNMTKMQDLTFIPKT